MADPRHRLEVSRRKPGAAILVAAPLALLATGVAVTAGVASFDAPREAGLVADRAAVEDTVDRGPVVSRGGARFEPMPRTRETRRGSTLSDVDRALRPSTVSAAIREARVRRWTTTELNVWTRPDQSAEQVGVLPLAERVLITGREMLSRQEIVLDGKARWVTFGYLSDQKPDPGPTLGGQCTNGTSVPAGVSAYIRDIHEAVCASFPEITTYGTLRGDGEHARGIAMDIMVSGDRAWQVAEFLRGNSSELGVSYVIHARRIWSVQRSSEGWRLMEDRGSATANHYDHVHVTTY